MLGDLTCKQAARTKARALLYWLGMHRPRAHLSRMSGDLQATCSHPAPARTSAGRLASKLLYSTVHCCTTQVHTYLSRILGDLQSKWMMLHLWRKLRAWATSRAMSRPCLYHDTRRHCNGEEGGQYRTVCKGVQPCLYHDTRRHCRQQGRGV